MSAPKPTTRRRKVLNRTKSEEKKIDEPARKPPELEKAEIADPFSTLEADIPDDERPAVSSTNTEQPADSAGPADTQPAAPSADAGASVNVSRRRHAFSPTRSENGSRNVAPCLGSSVPG